MSSNLVTGEAVELELQYAKLATRGIAFGIDVLVQATLLLVLYLVVLPRADVDVALLTTIVLLIAILVLVGYPVILETLTRGRTLGKVALGLRVVRDDGGPITFRHALVRALAGFFVDFWALGLAGFVAVVVSLSSTKGKRVGDFLAGSVVIRVRAPQQSPAPVGMPPQLERWAAELDLSRLPDGLALAVRQYLSRFGTLDPNARAELGAKLASDVSHYIGVPIPPGDGPPYLAAVLAERRRREERRMPYSASAPPAPVNGAFSAQNAVNGAFPASNAPKAPFTSAPRQSPSEGPFAPPE